MKGLVLFVHGFYGLPLTKVSNNQSGSADSFEKFPIHIIQNLHSKNIQCDFSSFEYTSQGNISLHSKTLVENLLLGANSDIRPFVVIISHSFGGLIVADAISQLLKTNQCRFDLSLPLNQSSQCVNIGGFVSFDSPYFGVQHEHVAKEGLRRALDYFQSPTPSSTSSSNNLSSSVNLSSITSLNSIGWGVAAAALASGILYNVSPQFKNSMDQMYTTHIDPLKENFEFLKPIMDNGMMEERVLGMRKFRFDRTRFFYVEIVKNEKDFDGNDLPNQFEFHTFVNLSPLKHADLFHPIKYYTDSSSVLVHTSIFKKEFDPDNYDKILKDMSVFIEEATDIFGVGNVIGIKAFAD